MSKIELCSIENCSGCKVCAEACPKKCITFKETAEGFYIPQIDRNLCIECEKCMKTCPVINVPLNNNLPRPSVVYGSSRNQETVKSSSSGGYFAELAKWMVQEGGIVCGVMQEKESLRCKNIFIENIEDIELLQGSKYVQSDATGIYTKVLNFLKSGRNVLFSGTPCQISAIKNFIPPKYHNALYLVEVICHGVPSYSFFKIYLDKVTSDSIISFSFRNNKIWDFDTSYISKHKEHKFLLGDKDFYMRAFLHGEIFQEACYNCPFAKLPRQADLTLGDFWGINLYADRSNINWCGNSVALINNEKGEYLTNVLNDSCTCRPIELDSVAVRNHNIYEPSKRPKYRDDIYNDIAKMSLKEICKKYHHSYTLRNYLGFLRRRFKEMIIG